MTGRRQFSSLRRAAGRNSAKRKFILFCEGVNTEPDYFSALQASFGGTLIEIHPIGGDPQAVTGHAISYAKSNGWPKEAVEKSWIPSNAQTKFGQSLTETTILISTKLLSLAVTMAFQSRDQIHASKSGLFCISSNSIDQTIGTMCKNI